MATEKIPSPGYVWSIMTMKCPRCRRGPMFNDPNPYRKFSFIHFKRSMNHIFDMPAHCPECQQRYDLEPGFWYGTGYVSYALAVAICLTTFIAWLVLIGISTDDNRIFAWLIFNGILLVILQPWLMRLSRVIYIRFFVRYDENYTANQPKKFE